MTAAYRFLPWTRQGMASQVVTPDPLDDTLAPRAQFPVRVRVNAGSPAGVDVSLYGPGDVVGVDPRGIVRTDPARHATDVEPNYLASIEFDRPDFPWMFTPAAADDADRLRPWLVLVVVAATDGVRVQSDRARPLPTVTVPTDELPPLAESWAWAHGQVITDEDSTAAIVDAVRHQPDLNVSRILCPRRLEPDTGYLACLVPAFAAGVQAGLGQPVDEANLGPAWDPTTDRVLLPVYHHWGFATGPAGDFESLARRLTPPATPLQVGTSPLDVSRADPSLPDLDGDAAILSMEGALVGPFHEFSGAVEDLDPDWLQALAAILDAPATLLDAGSPDAPPVSPPLHGGWPAHVQRVSGSPPAWFRELNLDPRFRAVAGLAVEVVRANQEELMHDAWVQVGNVLAANALLGRARFSREVAGRLHRRVFTPMGPEGVFRLAAPLHDRVLVDQVTVAARLRASVVPTTAADGAFRRLTARGGRILGVAARRSGAAAPASVASMVARLDDGGLAAIPPEVVPDAVSTARALDLLDVTATGEVDLTVIGGKRTVAADVILDLRTGPGKVGPVPAPGRVVLRDDLDTSVVVRGGLGGVLAGGAGGGVVARSADAGLVTDVAGDAAPGRAGPRHRPPGGPIVPRPRPPGDTTLPPPGEPDEPDEPTPAERKAIAARLRTAYAAHVATLAEEPAVPVRPALGLAEVRARIVEATRPGLVVPARVASMVRIDEPTGADGSAGGTGIISTTPDLGGLQGSPRLRRPLYEPLAAHAPERLLPGIGTVPTNTVALLKTNPRFVEAFLIAANGEFAGELVWREYPARRDGTAMRHFWDRADGAPDIPAISGFDPGSRLGRTAGGGGDGDVVLLLRGDLLRRYPTVAIHLVAATPTGGLGEDPADHVEPTMRGQIDPDVTFIGFGMGIAEVLAGAGHFVVIQQQPTEPRFGFDVPVAGEETPATWRDATWGHLGVAPGAHLAVDLEDAVVPADPGGTTVVRNAAHLAAITLQQPVRVAIHARDLLGGEVG